jgi:hypothetical protein
MVTSKARAFLPWLVIVIGGTASFARQGQIQDELRKQQTELLLHQNTLAHQLQINEELRNERAKAIADAILRQCIENYRIDGKLSKLGMRLFAIPSLNISAKLALAEFASEVAQNQGELQCQNPLLPRLTTEK